jgi:hypothetical protein
MSKTLITILAGMMLAIPFTPPAFAQAVGGPGSTGTRIDAFATDRFGPILFRGGGWAQVTVDGDGDTDLDLYIYDARGTLVASDDDELDYCVARWRPADTGYYTIVVKNRGRVYNDYTLRIN